MVPDVENGLSYDAFNLVIDELDISIGYGWLYDLNEVIEAFNAVLVVFLYFFWVCHTCLYFRVQK